MKYAMLLLLAIFLAGCASTETDRCRKVDGVMKCDPKEPREPREPRGGRFNI